MSELNFNFLVPDPCITEKNSLWAGINSGKNVETSIFLKTFNMIRPKKLSHLLEHMTYIHIPSFLEINILEKGAFKSPVWLNLSGSFSFPWNHHHV